MTRKLKKLNEIIYIDLYSMYIYVFHIYLNSYSINFIHIYEYKLHGDYK